MNTLDDATEKPGWRCGWHHKEWTDEKNRRCTWCWEHTPAGGKWRVLREQTTQADGRYWYLVPWTWPNYWKWETKGVDITQAAHLVMPWTRGVDWMLANRWEGQ